MRIAALVLAAGGSTRLGQPKQLIRRLGESLLRNAVRHALDAGCDRVIAVLGANAEECAAEIADLAIKVAINPEWSAGIGSSIAVGMRKLGEVEPECGAVMLTVCDQLDLTALALGRLLEAYRRSGSPIVASAYAETLGVPAIFNRDYFPALMQLSAKAGAQRLIREAPAERVLAVPLPEAERDLDTPSDLERLVGANR